MLHSFEIFSVTVHFFSDFKDNHVDNYAAAAQPMINFLNLSSRQMKVTKNYMQVICMSLW